jgi:SNF2 family DNA or RNA helicase
MYILHAHWQPPSTPNDAGALCLWAENALAAQPAKATKLPKGGPHPFSAEPTVIHRLLDELTRCGGKANAGQIALRLPTTRTGPQSSPQLLHTWELDSRTTPTLVPWTVGVDRLPPLTAYQLLTQLPAPSELPPNIRLGDDLLFWQAALHLALEVLAQQKILPTLTPASADGKTYHARWVSVLDGPRDEVRLHYLVEAMPPLCRAEAGSGDVAPHPRHLLDSFLNTIIDTLARHWGQGRYIHPDFAAQEPVYQWLRALFQNDPTVKGPVAQLQRLYTSYRAWLRNLQVAGDRHFRVAFRLEAPIQQAEPTSKSKKAASDWLLHFLLQARDDPSLLAPADQVWQTRSSVLKALGRHFEQPQEKLLAGLGYAARLFDPLRRSLQGAKPESATLSTQEAYTFLREAAPLLEESGFGVLVPPWWNKPGTRLGVRLHMRSNRQVSADAVTSNGMSMEKLVSYRWELALGDTALTKEEFQALVALKSPLVQIRGQWVQLDPEQIEAAIEFWQKHDMEADLNLQDAMGLALGAQGVDGLPVENVQVDGWLADWMARFTGNEKMNVLPPPQGLHATLRPYQAYGYSWLEFLRRWGMGACLADDMGLGKTIQTLSLLLRLKEEAKTLPGPVLLIAPTSVVTNWAKETQRFAPDLLTHVHQGGQRLRDKALVGQAKAVDLVLTSYPLVRRDAEALHKVDWFGVILDEAQNIKNPEARQTRTIRDLPAGFRVALTGTPVENRLTELWSIMNFLNPGYLGSRAAFRQHYALPIERYQDKEAATQLRKLVSPFILRRVKTDPTVIQDLPDKVETKVYCPLTEEQATLYEAVVQKALKEINDAESDMARRGQVLSMLMQLKQICNHPAQYLHQVSADYSAEGHPPGGEDKRSGKLLWLIELLEEITAVGDRALIFTQFAEMGHLLRSYLQQWLGVPTLFLHGGSSAKQRKSMVERFQDDPDGPPIFILSIKAGGVGLNLTRANHVFHFDRWWNPAVENQATDRAFRIGQQRNVQVHKFVCTGTLEERIDEMIERKKALAESVVGAGENWLTELSTNELREMVTLRRELVE